ncbi:MAG: sigma-E processing peptidase SpoIIGA [Candidatus Syntrophonatronum acetioxidans]|uniref:Sporulation sigma-E factor-processing peptidase n=1 Tax=Candidatus Syntrophonatronum acetioxidans TaxID=1795816 RepID=A0A424YBL2_9FIRM|nr:MAG: sigma-E processing peptidase SpoIIGA [Candidatus Syntrophonatronum acetioxidans]
MYVDEMLLVNLTMNFSILWLTAKICRKEYSKKKLLAGALLGALYVLSIFFPFKGLLLSLSAKLFLSLAIVFISFYPLTLKEYFLLLSTFYLVSFTIGGASLAFSYSLLAPPAFSGGMLFLPPLSLWNIIISFCLLLALGKWGVDYLAQRKWQNIFQVTLIIKILDRDFNIKGILDTGNRLKEPISQEPAIVVQYTAVKEVLPEEVLKCLGSHDDFCLDFDLEDLSNSPLAARLCFIPYSSLGRKKGFLLGIRPEEVKVWDKDGEVEIIGKAVIALCRDAFTGKSEYQALLPPALLADST